MTREYQQIMILDKSKCFIITIEKDNTAILQSFQKREDCSIPKLEKGEDMLKMTIQFLKRAFPKIKRILLTDKSIIKCKNKKIKLCNLYTLTRGISWYGKYGFIPLDNKKNYKRNKRIMDNTNALSYKTFLERYKIRYNKKELLRTVLKREFEKDCSKYLQYGDKIFRKLELSSMFGEVFYLDLLKK